MKENLTQRMQHCIEQPCKSSTEWYELGNAFRRQSDWQHALECYNYATELEPDGPASKARQMLMNILEYRCKELYNP